MNRTQVVTFVFGVLTMVGGAFVSKYLDGAAGIAIVAAGGILVGLPVNPRAMQK